MSVTTRRGDKTERIQAAKLVYSSKGSVAKQTQLKGESDRVQVYTTRPFKIF